MHELAVTESILEIASSYAEKSKASRVTRINLVIGRLSSIVDDSVQFYWDPIAEGTICSGSTLSFKRLPAILHCTTCNQDYQIEEELTPCPICGGYQTTIVSGEEFFVESIEIEIEQEAEGTK
jgi:hydrogenase nickel incorporation protein HypA/HybF